MRNTRVLFAASLFAGAGVALAAGCGSSKSGGTTPETGNDASSSVDAAEEPSGGPGAGCGFIAVGNSVMSCEPGMGLSCCINILNAFTNYENSEALGTC